ncbi:quinolinate synthase NadA [Sulfitobacter pseudonitzschiae]|uniref:Quinolinate synthase n=1 Tax=Pseudosulfitobacter pseudonitzschiae TaxID=1402135 RepID=A0A9Q2NIZ0_9RHOB|nr:quinolinate synthase NadA [Pseudosulfitobacter pseudonitzschiae]MBM2293168.1 quinolinate synthase NadA [Pseudosulfitobacter pseudonitzschiae]MBM2297855.1 quinolinate synthase NadA [Pseudosulfitobacter pseudonitzschiae]MBM2302769.1 quinolinate synthase NadA [Pseudosulfitobacter pseudonitzschiae]MBM2312565.1 quinolinate synthase NadA [Pseudosulfitobacter pseudonitzschiae]MBM2317465.1 quinolinate synthase NadA [Pseudosulfitobacter pseudonitzschiae]|tara:strand:+ start:10766 stop:11818 length:1053 start_codon:yes stop_codon:yes gene_type:complete
MLDLTDIRSELGNHYDLAPSVDLAAEMPEIYARMDRVVSPPDFAIYAPYIKAINALKKERNAVILAHNYMTPQIYHGIADVVGDSLQLAIEATKVEADVIVQCGVHFMAETSKILNPSKTVLIPDMDAGCSLAESITAEGIAEMRAKYPGAPVVTYVNTTAEVKAASDICCTSSNAAQIVAAQESDTVIMTPDKYLAQNVAKDVPHKRIVWWDGACIVHEQFTAQDLRDFRASEPTTRIIAHPECPPDVVAEADFSGSTSGIIDYVNSERPEKALLVTECSMGSNIANAMPDVDFVGPCNMCPFMKMITLEKVLWTLHSMQGAVEVDPQVADRARVAVQRMIDVSRTQAA